MTSLPVLALHLIAERLPAFSGCLVTTSVLLQEGRHFHLRSDFEKLMDAEFLPRRPMVTEVTTCTSSNLFLHN